MSFGEDRLIAHEPGSRAAGVRFEVRGSRIVMGGPQTSNFKLQTTVGSLAYQEVLKQLVEGNHSGVEADYHRTWRPEP